MQRKTPLPSVAERLRALPAYPFALITQRVAELNAQGADIINLDVGSPDMPPPKLVIDTLSDAAHRSDSHGYSGYRGTPGFRQAVADYYARRFGITLNPNTHVLPLMGSKEGIVNLSLAYLDRGDISLVPEVGYPAYSMGARLAGASVHWVPNPESLGYLIDFDALEHTLPANAKLIWLNYPHNPTGAVADDAFYARAADFCRRHDLLMASDNPYVDVTFDGFRAGSALKPAGALDIGIEFITFSKTFNMAGWRLGAAVGSPDVLRALLTVKSNMDSGHFLPVYEAGEAALEEVPDEWIAARNMVYQRRRDRILGAMPRIGLAPFRPLGALYVWGRVLDPSLDGARYVEEALMTAHVSMAPGAIYGPGGTQYVRMSVCTVDDRLEQALDRLERWYAGRS
jgi:LL-diaminopimelate aminotransferase